MMGFYTSPLGAIYAQLVGESQFYPTERERIRTHQVNVRRAAVRKIWDRRRFCVGRHLDISTD
jgi:hypothetical protein